MSAIGIMVCSISHDMRHSLTAIYANAEFLERPIYVRACGMICCSKFKKQCSR